MWPGTIGQERSFVDLHQTVNAGPERIMKQFNRNLITLYATQELLDFVKAIKPNLYQWTLSTINNRPPAYLIDVEDQNCHGMVLEKHFVEITENVLGSLLYIEKEAWPKEITFELFSRWFSYQYHEEIFDLSTQLLQSYEE
jgi:hypothetical protein